MTAWGGATLRGCESGRVRKLKGFVKGAHFEPEAHSPAAEAFVRKAGESAIAERAETLFKQLRTAFGYKRKDLTYSCDGGMAAIRTPDFEVGLVMEQDPADPRSYLVALTVGGFARPEVVTEDAFLEVFRFHCDTVAIAFPRAIDVEARIDALEEASDLADFLDYPADASSLSITVPGALVTMELRAHAVCFSLLPGGDLRQLIEGTRKLLSAFSQAGVGLGALAHGQ